MPSPKGAYAYAAVNSRKRCRLPGCTSNRCGISGFCRRHHRGNTRHGHPEGRKINPKEYAHEKKVVAEFLERHVQHEGLQSAQRWLDRWLHAASVGEAVPGQREMARIAEHRLPAKHLLLEVCSVFLFARWQPRRLPDDERLTFALATGVLGLVPQEKRYGHKNGKPYYRSVPLRKVGKREIGTRIRLHLAPLLLNVALGIEAEADQRQRELLSLHQPFVLKKEDSPTDVD